MTSEPSTRHAECIAPLHGSTASGTEEVIRRRRPRRIPGMIAAMIDQERPVVPSGERSLPNVINRLVAATETLAALVVHLASESGDLTLDPESARRVKALADAVVDLDDTDPATVRVQGAMGRAMLAQAAAFSATPTEPGTWAITDPVMLQTLGRGSSAFASLIVQQIAPRIPGFSEQISVPNGRVLDVGAGVGALAIEFARQLPLATVVGLDVWPPAIALARANVEAAGLAGRVEIREQDVTTLADQSIYNLVWFAGPFIPGAIQTLALQRCVRSLCPDGWLVYGAFGGGDALTSALGDLRTLRSGGPALSTTEIVSMLTDAGLADVQATTVSVGIPSRVIVGRRAPSASPARPALPTSSVLGEMGQNS